MRGLNEFSRKKICPIGNPGPPAERETRLFARPRQFPSSERAKRTERCHPLMSSSRRHESFRSILFAREPLNKMRNSATLPLKSDSETRAGYEGSRRSWFFHSTLLRRVRRSASATREKERERERQGGGGGEGRGREVVEYRNPRPCECEEKEEDQVGRGGVDGKRTRDRGKDGNEREMANSLSRREMNNSVQARIVGRAHVQSRMYTGLRGVPGMKLSVGCSRHKSLIVRTSVIALVRKGLVRRASMGRSLTRLRSLRAILRKWYPYLTLESDVRDVQSIALNLTRTETWRNFKITRTLFLLFMYGKIWRLRIPHILGIILQCY